MLRRPPTKITLTTDDLLSYDTRSRAEAELAAQQAHQARLELARQELAHQERVRQEQTRQEQLARTEISRHTTQNGTGQMRQAMGTGMGGRAGFQAVNGATAAGEERRRRERRERIGG